MVGRRAAREDRPAGYYQVGISHVLRQRLSGGKGQRAIAQALGDRPSDPATAAVLPHNDS